MRCICLLGVLATAAATATTTMQFQQGRRSLSDANLSAAEKWDLYKLTFDKTYETTDLEAARFAAFLANEATIVAHNAGTSTFTLGHNDFSDLSWSEFKAMYVSGMDSNPHLRRPKNYDLSMQGVEAKADSVDWVTAGAVTPIKNQGQCGSCWAFSTTGSFEGAYQIATGSLVSFSEQQLVSCDKVDDGCSGGLMENGLTWIKKNGGICTESSYPYTSGEGTTGTCKEKCSNVGTLKAYTDVTPSDEGALKTAVEKGPVSVAIEADKSVFQLYAGGVFTSAKECGTSLDHGVLAVGYGTDGSNDYWKVKNSWGSSWGEKGYIRMERGADCCGIAMQPCYPTGVSSLGPAPTPKPGPGPTPTPTPTPTPGGHTHYGAPPCLSDEQDVQVQGISGDFCSPPCTNSECPTDVPSGVTADPSCLLQDTSGSKYCALQCDPDEDSECGEGSCQSIQGTGICTYGSSPGPSPGPSPTPSPGPSGSCFKKEHKKKCKEDSGCEWCGYSGYGICIPNDITCP